MAASKTPESLGGKTPSPVLDSGSPKRGRHLRYNVAMSLDGFIAGQQNEYDWISVTESDDFDFARLFAEFDTFLVGRHTYEVLKAQGSQNPLRNLTKEQMFVFSRSMRSSDLSPDEAAGFTLLSSIDAVASLKSDATKTKDIWLFGGGLLFRELLDRGLVDSVEVAIMPVLLGRGIPLLAEGRRSPPLTLTSTRILSSGVVMLTYKVNN